MTAPGTSTGVLLMTYGSAATVDDLPAFLKSVRHGHEAPEDLRAEFERRYRLIGFSPLVRITQAQGQALQELLDREHGRGSFRVEVGMLHSEPGVDAAMQRLGAAGVARVCAIVLSPQWSPLIMSGYTRAVEGAAHHIESGRVEVAGPWYFVDEFLDALASRVREALAAFTGDEREKLMVVLTVHSLPRAVVEREPEYLAQLMETIDEVVHRSGLRAGDWQFAYQSAGHSAEEWLTPDLKDILPGIRAAGRTGVLVVPVQFLADHLEILYDLDVAAREEAESAGLTFHRIELMNTSAGFINALRAVVEREVDRQVFTEVGR